MKKIAISIAALALAVLPAVSADAASPIYIKNHISSVVNVSMTTTNPASAGHIYSIRPGYAFTGAGFYAACGKLTQYWYAGGPVKTARACYWNYPPYISGGAQYTVRVFN